MPDIRELIPITQRTGSNQSFKGVWYAKFALPFPTTLTEMCYVIIPDIDKDHKWGPCRWQSRDVALPDSDNEALVAFDNRNNLWVVTWW